MCIQLVLDNLNNTHFEGSLIENVQQEKSKKASEKDQIHLSFYTPKHGSWLNKAE